MNEREGTALLKARFEAAGYRIREGFRYQSGGVSFSMDGFDPDARVGFEYVTTAAGDRAEITPEVVAHLERRMRAGEIAVLLLDEREAPSKDLLEFAAARFLAAVARPQPKAAKTKKASAKPKKAPKGKKKAAKGKK